MPSSPFQLDKLDAAIVALLQEDGRRPYGEIGEAVGLSEAATRQRVNRLRESGLMRIVAVTDPVALGRGVVATVGLRVSGDSRAVAARLAQVAEVEYVVVTAGAFDVLAELVCASEDELLDVLDDDIRTIAEVREMQILMHLRTEKNVFAWGQRPSEE
ncbi:MAG TPA: Lrp/AsnC family transcriptional regulator [Solirubrobacteraceae bacterium]|jgi:Lrp/AsnC family transcriptional regulator for asnA, asnC and gidA